MNTAERFPSILIVDDSLTVRMDLAEAFEDAGFRVVSCETVAQAREALAHESVQLAVLDVLLPDGDGVDLLREIRSYPASASMPVLILSSESEVEDRIRGLRTGADEYVGKPYETGYVIAKARQLLGHQQRKQDDGRTNVLIIDDSPTFRKRLAQTLREAGYGVLEANSGEQGLLLAADARPAAVVVDGSLPGINGSTVIRRLRLDAALRGLACILLTASDDRGAELEALDAGADAFVHKDGDGDLLLAKLAAALRGAHHLVTDTASLHGPKKILAVDDSITYLQELGDALREEGYDVITARSGEEALDLLSVQPVDCILLDLVMPGVDGNETCRRIKSAPAVRDIPLIMLTALDERAAMLEGLSAGADDYIAKSGEFTVLKARLRAQLRRKQFEEEHRRIREELMRKELEGAQARAERELAQTRSALVEQLERKNQELESFSYSVSHDLRSPLLAIAGFSQVLVRDYADQLDGRGQQYLARISSGARRMAELIDDLLHLAKVNNRELARESVNLSELVRRTMTELQRLASDRHVELVIHDELTHEADPQLVKILLENLLGNAWKFTAKTPRARIEFTAETQAGERVYVVHDNGAGFDMAYSDKLFQPFQRLHADKDFPGTGIGLATVRRIVERHGGRAWARSRPGEGASFYFTLTEETRPNGPS